MSVSSFILFFSLIIITVGCESKVDSKLNAEEVSTENYIVDTLNTFQLKEKINIRNGKILFVNFWATWCVPCVEEFPALVKLAENYKHSDIEFLSLSVDLVKDINSSVIPFLQNQKANFPVYVIPEKESEKIINLVQPDWNGAIPATAIFDIHGKLVEFFTGLETYDTFKQKINKALKM